MKHKSVHLLLFTLIGFTGVIAQVIIIREFMNVFYGNELVIGIVLANWLMWTAAGSMFFNRFAVRFNSPVKLVPPILFVIAIFAPITVFIIRISKSLFVTVTGELTSIIQVILSSISILSPLCFLLGSLFTIASIIYSNNYTQSTGTVYKFESIGAAAGGAILSFILLGKLNSFQIIFIISILNISAALTLIQHNFSKRWWLTFLAVIIISIFALIPVGEKLNNYTFGKLWQGFDLVETRDTNYGNLAVLDINGEKSIYENGVKIVSGEDAATNEESVHYALLAHKKPQTVLLIGDGISGSINEILKYQTIQHVDYTELDPAVFEIGKEYFPQNWNTIINDNRVYLFQQDGRFFIKQTENKYDVIIINIGDPLNANVNRYYTREFFLEASQELNPNGILTFQLTSSENYMNDELVNFLKIINKTLQNVFVEVEIIPGDNIHFFASNQKGSLSNDADLFITRLNKRQVKTDFVNEHYIHFKLTPDRIEQVKNEIQPDFETRLNEDFTPVAYFYNIIFWNSQFISIFNYWIEILKSISFWYFLIFFVCLSVVIYFISFIRIGSDRTNAGFAVFIMGFSLISLQLILLLGFQAKFGYVYQQLALLIGVFMAGIATGSNVALKQVVKPKVKLKNKLVNIHLLLAILPIILILFLSEVISYLYYIDESFFTWFIFPLFALICGGAGGYQFPFTSKLYFGTGSNINQNAGILYGIDILGAMVGTILLTIIMIPLFGFYEVALFAFIINVLISISFLISSKKIK